MKLRELGHDDHIIDSIYQRLVSMSKSHERRQMLRSIRVLIELRDLISFTKRSDLLLELSESDDWYVAEKATAALEKLSG